jgi:hypothetical protein
MTHREVNASSAPSIDLPDTLTVDLVVLPREIDEAGQGLYDDSVVDLVKVLNLDGVKAAYLHDQTHRSWIGEKSFADVALNFIVGIASSAAWSGFLAMLSNKRANTQVKGKIARVTQTPLGTTWEWFEVEGTGEQVAEALKAIPPSNPPERQALDDGK